MTSEELIQLLEAWPDDAILGWTFAGPASSARKQHDARGMLAIARDYGSDRVFVEIQDHDHFWIHVDPLITVSEGSPLFPVLLERMKKFYLERAEREREGKE